MDVFSLIKQARENGCSDLHITAGTAIAVRKYGELFMLDQVPTLEESEEMILSLLKEDEAKFVLAGNDLDVAVSDEKGNRIRGNVYHQRNNLAASIRLIDSNIPTLSELNMPPVIQKLAELRGGLVLVTGPTGSGKSTTLYTALSELNKEDVNIITVEDPVEANIEGINQVQTNVKAGLTFASALRSILRQDPDIIMIGEIRDQETASIAVTASITGHLVVSTLHTNSSAASITRLADMGLEYYLIADSVVGVIAQRLVRRLCPTCRKERLANEREKKILGCEGEEEVKIWDPVGCPQCGYNGYRGRIGVYELMPISPRIRNIIASKGTTEQIENAALADGMYTLQMACSKHVKNAVTSINELKRIVYAGEDVDDAEATS